jgi:hypothetical protein
MAVIWDLGGYFLHDIFAPIVITLVVARYSTGLFDYEAKWSAKSRYKKIKKLEYRLARYETIFSDSRLYTAHLLRHTVVIIICSGTLATSIIMFQLECGLQNHCMLKEPQWESMTWHDILEIVICFVWMCASIFSTFIMYDCVTVLARQALPEKYRDYIQKRIRRLRGRLPAQGTQLQG